VLLRRLIERSTGTVPKGIKYVVEGNYIFT